jgi:hypothetical protein
LMRIMDGTSRRADFKKNSNKSSKTFLSENVPEEQLSKNRLKNIRVQEEELRKYEERIFIEHIVESEKHIIRRNFSKEYDDIRGKHSKGSCPFYNGGEKRVWETELNVNPFFEKMSQRLLTQPVNDIEDLTRLGRQH